MKEHERREGTKEGFTDAAGDVLAFKHFRDVSERASERRRAWRRGRRTVVAAVFWLLGLRGQAACESTFACLPACLF